MKTWMNTFSVCVRQHFDRSNLFQLLPFSGNKTITKTINLIHLTHINASYKLFFRITPTATTFDMRGYERTKNCLIAYYDERQKAFYFNINIESTHTDTLWCHHYWWMFSRSMLCYYLSDVHMTVYGVPT